MRDGLLRTISAANGEQHGPCGLRGPSDAQLLAGMNAVDLDEQPKQLQRTLMFTGTAARTSPAHTRDAGSDDRAVLG